MNYKGQYINESDVLTYALQNNTIDIVDIQSQMEQMKREQYLEMHEENHKIWQGTNGKWKTYIDDDSERGYSLKERKTKQEIEDLIVKAYEDKENDPYIKQVFSSWNNERLKYREILPQTFYKYENIFKRYFTSDCELCAKKLRYITEDDLTEFIKTTIQKFEMTHKSFSDLRTVICGIFKYSKQHKYTNISITSFFGDLELSPRIFKKHTVDKKKEVFDESEIEMIQSYLWDHGTIRDLGILLAFQTGVRVGELSALKKTDIAKDFSSIHVQRTEVTYKDNVTKKRVYKVQDFTKTEAGNRYIYVPKSTADTINAIMRLNIDGEYLFCDNGKRIKSNAFNRRLTRVCNDLNIPQRSMHKIRKTYGTTLLDHGVPDSLVADQMGHTDVATTRKYYYYCNCTSDEALKQIDKAFTC